MGCPTYKKLCNRLVISQAVTFANGVLTINIPEGSYTNGEKYCIVVAQNLPDTTTIVAPVEITIGDGTVSYSLVNSNCTNVTACSISRRTRYSVCVRTDIQDGVFKLLGRLPCTKCNENLTALTGDAPASVPAG